MFFYIQQEKSWKKKKNVIVYLYDCVWSQLGLIVHLIHPSNGKAFQSISSFYKRKTYVEEKIIVCIVNNVIMFEPVLHQPGNSRR